MSELTEILSRPNTSPAAIEEIAAEVELVADRARNHEHDFEVLQLLIELDETVERLRKLVRSRLPRLDR